MKEFVALAEMKTFTKVGEELNTTTSSVSRHIQALENELGVDLVERNPRGVALTEYGELFLPYAKQLVDIDHQCTQKLKNARQKEKVLLRLGSSPYTAAGLITGFAKANPDIPFTLREYSEDLITDMLDLGEFEVGIGERSLIVGFGKRYLFMPYETRSYYVMLPQGHPLADRQEISPVEIADELLVIEKSSFPTVNLLYDLFRTVGAEPKDIIYVNSSARVYVANGVGIGVALLSPQDRPDGVVCIPLKVTKHKEIGILYLGKVKLSAPAMRMVQYVLDCQAD